jgi:hypothetical protein
MKSAPVEQTFAHAPQLSHFERSMAASCISMLPMLLLFMDAEFVLQKSVSDNVCPTGRIPLPLYPAIFISPDEMAPRGQELRQ